MLRTLSTAIAIILLLQGCQTAEPDPQTGGGEEAEPKAAITVLSEPEVITGPAPIDRERLIADTLFEGLQALDDNRLLTPVDESAHGRFMRVLAIDPGNEIAQQGLQDIVLRYLQLSEEASRRGLFVEAETLLDNARFVDEDHPDIAKSSQALQAEMDSGDLFFELNQQAFSKRSEEAQEILADIARQARQHSAFFLITAPNDDLARWMFSIMRAAVEGYRLRGNIALANRTSVRLRMPSKPGPSD